MSTTLASFLNFKQGLPPLTVVTPLVRLPIISEKKTSTMRVVSALVAVAGLLTAVPSALGRSWPFAIRAVFITSAFFSATITITGPSSANYWYDSLVCCSAYTQRACRTQGSEHFQPNHLGLHRRKPQPRIVCVNFHLCCDPCLTYSNRITVTNSNSSDLNGVFAVCLIFSITTSSTRSHWGYSFIDSRTGRPFE